VIRLKLKLNPKNNAPISLNYKYYLAAICNELINSCSQDICEKLAKNSIDFYSEKRELLTFTQFYCSDYEIKDSKIVFKGTISWYISSPEYELILHIVQKLFNLNLLKVGNEEFEILSFEAKEIEDTLVTGISNGNLTVPSDRISEILDKLDSYYLLSKDEMII
jgi:CRISPR/Cas system endoribonuclease Cas6 (RAMP superfamily)